MSLQSFRLSIRFILPLALVLGLFAYAVVPLVDDMTLRWFVRDLERARRWCRQPCRSRLQNTCRKARTGDRAAAGPLRAGRPAFALAFCNPQGGLVYKTASYPDALGCPPSNYAEPLRQSMLTLPRGSRIHVTESTLRNGAQYLGKLILVHDMSFVERRSADTKQYVIALFALLAVVISLITVFIAQLSWRGWVNAMQALLRGETGSRVAVGHRRRPKCGRSSATCGRCCAISRPSGARDESSAHCGRRTRCASLLHDELAGDEVMVVSNREPYIHVRGTATASRCGVPASGLVTALEPVMRACSGTWIAHGSGSADRETVDAQRPRRRCRPDKPAYTLRRVWLTRGGRAGLLLRLRQRRPVAALPHRPRAAGVPRVATGSSTCAVNQRFADAVVAEARHRRSDRPGAGLSLRAAAAHDPRAAAAGDDHHLLAHPVAEPGAFGICPWREEMLDGLLGSSILGFHTQFHCNNFLDTVDRYLEARIDRETFDRLLRRRADAGATAIRSRSSGRRRRCDRSRRCAECRAQRARRARACRRRSCSASASTGSTTPRASRSACRRSSGCSSCIRDWSGGSRSCRSPRPAAPTLDEYQQLRRARARAGRSASTQRFGSGGYQPIMLQDRASRAGRRCYEYYRAADVCVREQPARRHEPGRQGIRRRARRRAAACWSCRSSPAPRASCTRR